MPAIRGIYYTHPTTGDDGLWVHLTSRNLGLVGQTRTQMQALIPGGNQATRLARFEVTLNSVLQRLCEDWIPLSSLAPDDPIVLDHRPEYACRFETVQGVEYHVMPVVKIHVAVVSLVPLTFGAITVSEAASRSVYL